MSLIIKGINLPNTIKYYQILPNGDVYETAFDGLLKSDKPFQATEIPTPHGRLIDADWFIKQMKEDNPQTSKKKWAEIVAMFAPTIIEAED